MKLYTFVVHFLQICMKEYGYCPKFGRGDNSTYTFTKRGEGHVPCKHNYKLNYLPFQILDSDHISSSTSAGSVLQLCKVSQKSNKPFRRSCAYKVHDPPLIFVKLYTVVVHYL
jgi:hypothetical protein